jgi:seryl-tRNA synthetase
MTSAAAVDVTIPQSRAFVDGLVSAGLLLPTGSAGVWGRGPVFEHVVEGFERLITRETREDAATVMRFPPVIGRAHFERSEFLKSFPHLAGAVHCFDGTPDRHAELLSRIEDGREWSDLLSMADAVLVPAACYPVYPALRGRLPRGGSLMDVSSYCFRHEPSADPTRMVAFRMREQVRLGSPQEVVEFRDTWVQRAERLFAELALPAHPAPANDPFFGRGGRFLAKNQLEQGLKLELVMPIVSEQSLTPVMSFNYHQDHFGRAFDILMADGTRAHTACVGFGLERIALGLFKTHGFAIEHWPAAVVRKLWS